MKASIVPIDLPAATARRGSWLEKLGRKALLKQLRELSQGEVTLVENGVRMRFGVASATCPLRATLEIDHPQFWAQAAFGGTVGAAEAYIQGHWRCDDLTSLVRIMVVNREVMEQMEGGWAWVSAPTRRMLHFLNRNSKQGSQRNIASHYDLGNELFALFLDSTMAYSCGIFERPDASLFEASIAKFEAICRQLELKPTDHLLEIGTGWGGLAIHAAARYGCKVTTTTISREQYELAKQKIAEAGLSDRIELLLSDYRDLRGRYDKLVSVEMIEAVGARYLDTYFAHCSALLKPNGSMLLQAITIRDQLYEAALRNVDFIQRFVFPGSFIPSVSAICSSVQRVTDLKLFHLRDIGPHYAITLRRWREAFFANLERVKALGYPDGFVRLWEYYLCYCEGGFAERQLGAVQMLLTKPDCRRASIV